MNSGLSILILYEHKSREFETAVLLQRSLVSRGATCQISQYYDASNFSLIDNKFDVIVVPHLYNTKSVARVMARFGRPKFIVNLQYEQVLSKKWEEFGHHNPTGEAHKGVHVCWGQATTTRLAKVGVPTENLLQIGAPHFDLIKRVNHEIVRDFREFFSRKFAVDLGKKWVLFLSSFTYADIPAHRLEMNERITGSKLDDFVRIHTSSRVAIIDWLEQALLDNSDKVIIYRPHPDEHSLDALYDLADRFDNFFVIMYGSAKQWIMACDQILSWYSTTVVEAHFMGKAYNILRPFELPEYFDSVLLRKGVFIKKKQDFLDSLNNEIHEKDFALSHDDVEMYYQNIDSGNATFDLSDFIIRELERGRVSGFKISAHQMVRAKLVSLTVCLFYYIYRAQSRFKMLSIVRRLPFFDKWFQEFDKQFLVEREFHLVLRDVDRFFKGSVDRA